MEFAKREARQQWMCAMMVFDVKPLNVACTASVLAVGSSTIVADPVVPAVGVGGISSACVRLVVKVVGLA